MAVSKVGGDLTWFQGVTIPKVRTGAHAPIRIVPIDHPNHRAVHLELE
jgi:hypothetical protein